MKHKHIWTEIAQDGLSVKCSDDPVAIWKWCISCGALKIKFIGSKVLVFSPGKHQKKTIIEDKG